MYNIEHIYLKAPSRALKTVDVEEDGRMNDFKVSQAVSYSIYLVRAPAFNHQCYITIISA